MFSHIASKLVWNAFWEMWLLVLKKQTKGSLDIDSIKQFSKMKWKKWNVSFVFFMLVTAKYATLHAELNKA